VTIVDFKDNRDRFTSSINRGATYIIDRLTKENIDANAIIGWAHDNGVLYLNTSVEEWEPYAGGSSRDPIERTLYYRHMRLREMKAGWNKKGATAIVEHGANPGMVSHLVKRALIEIGTRAVAERKAGIAIDAIERAIGEDNYPALAHALDVRVIHVAERDTQISDKPKRVDEFVNTWSVEGFYEEGIAPAELGWGTHEKKLPPTAYTHKVGPQNQIALAQPGATTWVRSWVPSCETTGMVIRHGEAFTLSDHLTVWDGSKAIYRPTVHYAYCPTDAAIASMRETEMRQWNLQSDQRIMNEEIISGEDRLGVLLMGHPFKSWWCGSLLSIGEARKLAPGQSATTLQVAASVYAAVAWAMANPEAGLMVPDDLPWREVLPLIEPYLGTIWSDAVDWDPLASRFDPFKGWNHREYDESDPWQFTNFLA
jgi:homospermidine synthase